MEKSSEMTAWQNHTFQTPIEGMSKCQTLIEAIFKCQILLTAPFTTHQRHLRKVDEDEEGDVGVKVYVNVHVFLRVKGTGDIYREGLYILYM